MIRSKSVERPTYKSDLLTDRLRTGTKTFSVEDIYSNANIKKIRNIGNLRKDDLYLTTST